MNLGPAWKFFFCKRVLNIDTSEWPLVFQNIEIPNDLIDNYRKVELLKC